MKQLSKKKSPVVVLIGVSVSVILTLLLSVCGSIAISAELLPQKLSRYMVWYIAAAALAAGSWFAAKWCSKQKILSAAMVYIGYTAICLLGKGILFANFEFRPSTYLLLLPITALLGALLANRRYKKRR
jgi:putative membrane protein (TIGR04086 family)